MRRRALEKGARSLKGTSQRKSPAVGLVPLRLAAARAASSACVAAVALPDHCLLLSPLSAGLQDGRLGSLLISNPFHNAKHDRSTMLVEGRVEDAIETLEVRLPRVSASCASI